MDVLAHGLWTAAAARAGNIKLKKTLNLWRTVFWGVFPDLLAFTLPFAWFFLNIATGQMSLSDFPRPDPEGGPPSAAGKFFESGMVHLLYSLSHSLVIFLMIFAVVWTIYRRPILELLAWLLHILIDIPTHSYQFYPTPFLWPVSRVQVDGHSWAEPIFMLINYSALAIVYVLLAIRRRLKYNTNNKSS